jgi:hypothetical protein
MDKVDTYSLYPVDIVSGEIDREVNLGEYTPRQNDQEGSINGTDVRIYIPTLDTVQRQLQYNHLGILISPDIFDTETYYMHAETAARIHLFSKSIAESLLDQHDISRSIDHKMPVMPTNNKFALLNNSGLAIPVSRLIVPLIKINTSRAYLSALAA